MNHGTPTNQPSGNAEPRSGSEGSAELANDLWNLANLIAGFAGAQMIAFLYALLDSNGLGRVFLPQHKDAKEDWLLTVLAIGAFGWLYAWAIHSCDSVEKRLRVEAGHSELVLKTSKRVSSGRVWWVGMTAALGIAVMLPLYPGCSSSPALQTRSALSYEYPISADKNAALVSH